MTAKIGDKVNTEHGKGVIVAIEKYNHFNRYSVELEKNPFKFPVAYFFNEEIILAEEENV